MNNAGIALDQLVMRLKDEDWNRQLQVNLTGTFNLIRAATRPMMKARRRRDREPHLGRRRDGQRRARPPTRPPRPGQIGLTKSVARELASRNIRVNAVAPGYIETDMTAGLPEAAKAKMMELIPLARLGGGGGRRERGGVSRERSGIVRDRRGPAGQRRDVHVAAASAAADRRHPTTEEDTMSATIEQKVKNIIADQLGVGEEEIKTTSSFIEDLGADSLDIVELVMAMEEEFEVEIPDEEAENIKTVQDAVNYVTTHKK